jgi:hypothetical protein
MSRQLEIHPAVKKLRALTSSRPTLAVVLGSGFSLCLVTFGSKLRSPFLPSPVFRLLM